MTSIERTAPAIDRLPVSNVFGVFSTSSVGGVANPQFKASYDSPQATTKVLAEAVRTRNVALAMSCLTGAMQGGLYLAALRSEPRVILTPEQQDRVIRDRMLPLLTGYELGELLSSTDEKKVYAYKTVFGQGNTPQIFEKVDGKWLLAN